MIIGKVVKPVETLGTALAVRGKPTRPPRPNRRTGSMGYRKGHPNLTSAAVNPVAPVAKGVNQNALGGYLRALSGH